MSESSLAECRRMRFVLFVLVAACGQPDFNGRYKGSLDDTGTCSDGSSGSATHLVSWILNANTQSVTIATGGGGVSCPTLTATTHGALADIGAKVCPSYGDATTTVQETVRSGGTLSLDGNRLNVKLSVSVILYNPTNGSKATCDDSIFGTLIDGP